MKRLILVTLLFSALLGLLAHGCSKPPDAGHVGPVGPVGPQGNIGPQSMDSGSSDLTVIEDTDVYITKKYSFSDFIRLEISDGFDVTINRGPEYSISTKFEETAVPYIQMSRHEDTLIIRLEPERTYNMVNITLEINITMPELAEIVLRNGADVVVYDLSGYEADVDFLSSLHQGGLQ